MENQLWKGGGTLLVTLVLLLRIWSCLHHWQPVMILQSGYFTTAPLCSFLLMLMFGAVLSDSYISSQPRRIVIARRLLSFVGQYSYLITFWFRECLQLLWPYYFWRYVTRCDKYTAGQKTAPFLFSISIIFGTWYLSEFATKQWQNYPPLLMNVITLPSEKEHVSICS